MSENIKIVALNPRQNKHQEMTLSTIKERLSFQNEFSFTTPHMLEFYTLILVTEGEYKHILDNKTYCIKAGDLFVIPPNKVHYFIDLDGFDGYIITFSKQFLRDFVVAFNPMIRFELLYQFYFVKQMKLGENFQNQFIAIYQILLKEITIEYDKSQKVILKNLLSVILHNISREFKKRDMYDLVNVDKVFLDFIRELTLKVNYKHNVQYYADKLDISIRTFQNIVKKNINMTPKQVIDDNLILECKRQLLAPDLLIQDIAYNLGFDNPSVFSKFFKKMKGITPAEFRKQYLE